MELKRNGERPKLLAHPSMDAGLCDSATCFRPRTAYPGSAVITLLVSVDVTRSFGSAVRDLPEAFSRWRARRVSLLREALPRNPNPAAPHAPALKTAVVFRRSTAPDEGGELISGAGQAGEWSALTRVVSAGNP